MASSRLEEIRQNRIDKLNSLRKLGVDPYPAKSFRDIEIGKIEKAFASLEGNQVTIAGRVLSIRKHGQLAFVDLKDASGKTQAIVRQEALTAADHSQGQLTFNDLSLLDEGDFAEIAGTVTKSQTGEVSVDATSLRILVKSLRPLPTSWDGLKDKETRFRRRYVDTNINPEVYQRFVRRSKFWEAHRQFFKSHNFIEINIPVLEHIPGGGDATPFVTHMDAIDQDFYLRISQELYLKRLVGGGYDKVYEIGPRFRNEGLSDEHLPEHMAMEFYWAYADWSDGMKLIKELFNYVLDQVYPGKKEFDIRGFKVDFSKDWETIDFGQIMKDKFNLDVYSPTLNEVKNALQAAGIKTTGEVSIPRGVDALWKQLRTTIGGPAFLINHPKFLSPLQKPSVQNPLIVERFQPIIAGSELGNGWSEVNDPLDQFDRFSEQQRMRDEGDPEAQWLDVDYVEMLEYGMPPTFGYGHSERVFWFLEDVTAREGVPFPQLKFELDETTKRIYNLK
ncbi:MAG: amino acid--tRNA ligase-related protein [bacterium]|nr:amino acid--tRNA ligase-related protein [bacterium]